MSPPVSAQSATSMLQSAEPVHVHQPPGPVAGQVMSPVSVPYPIKSSMTSGLYNDSILNWPLRVSITVAFFNLSLAGAI